MDIILIDETDDEYDRSVMVSTHMVDIFKVADVLAGALVAFGYSPETVGKIFTDDVESMSVYRPNIPPEEDSPDAPEEQTHMTMIWQERDPRDDVQDPDYIVEPNKTKDLGNWPETRPECKNCETIKELKLWFTGELAKALQERIKDESKVENSTSLHAKDCLCSRCAKGLWREENSIPS
jgi:hypothetical protein